MSTPQEVFNAMPERFLPERARGVNAVIQFKLSGENGGEWYLTVADGQCTVEPGVSEKPRVTIAMADADYVALIEGTANPMQLFMAGKVKIDGDLMLAQAMTNWFAQP
ncbi:MAG: SCP2 sterol-binding domain-containing protein [Anaerolineae bacterium]|nr:SCP2 sterol-binding domain-containing protein [Anaerolineae bacterium]